MKKYFFVFIFFVLGPAVALAQQADLRKDDQRFFKGHPSLALGAPQHQHNKKSFQKTTKSWWSCLMIGANLSLLRY